MISKENTYSLIQKSDNLPTLPAILLKLLAACENDETPTAEIAAIISKDPTLSFKVLQLVNSAYYGFRFSFKSIDQAVVYLGANTIKNLAITMSVHQVFERKRFQNVRQFDINVFWYNSLICATLARRVGEKTGFSNLDEAYLSGLLLDIGRLILISTFPIEHETILAETKDRKNTLWAENQLLAITHPETGSWLMQKWNMSSTIADAIRYHHEPLDKIKEAFPLVKIAYIANFLCKNIDNPEQESEIDDLLTGLNGSDLQEIVEGVDEEVEEIAINLGIRIQKPSETDESPAKTSAAKSEKAQETGSVADSPYPPFMDENDVHEEALQETLTTRIKNISLLSTFLENLAQAGNTEEIIAACEQTMSILFNIEQVLFFLTGQEQVLLHGRTSPANSLHQASQGLTLTVQESSSLIVKTYHDMTIHSLTEDTAKDNLADQQILTMLQSDTVLLIPLVIDRRPGGVMLLGLPQPQQTLDAGDSKLVQVIAQQVGICVHLERMKKQKMAELDAERMAAISMTARKVAHEINNPLGIISNYIAAMKLRLTDNEQINSELTIIDEEIQRISSLIGQIDMFSKDRARILEFTDVNAAILNVIQLVESAHFTHAEIAISFLPDDNLPRINTSKDAIKQILINLLKNAAEAMNDGGQITVQTRQPTPEVANGREGIEIVVADTGPGLPESVTATMYSPFVTTKKNGHSGLGLSIVHKTIADLGGTVSYTSTRDGTSFSIFLPNTK